jgi:hypothetical protein
MTEGVNATEDAGTTQGPGADPACAGLPSRWASA